MLKARQNTYKALEDIVPASLLNWCFSLCLTQDLEPQSKPECHHHFAAACSRRNNHQNWQEAKAQDSLQVLLLGRWASLYTEQLNGQLKLRSYQTLECVLRLITELFFLL